MKWKNGQRLKQIYLRKRWRSMARTLVTYVMILLVYHTFLASISIPVVIAYYMYYVLLVVQNININHGVTASMENAQKHS